MKVYPFDILATAVDNQFKKLTSDAQSGKAVLLEVSISGLDDFYVESFPEEFNKMFRERREYDCNCCKHFVRQVGNIVALYNDHIETVWDVSLPEDSYYTLVSKELSQKVRNAYTTSDGTNVTTYYGDANIPIAGSARTPDKHTDIIWDHFHTTIPAFFLKPEDQLGTIKSEFQAARVVATKATTIALSDYELVLELLVGNSIYRAEQYVELFKTLTEFRRAYEECSNTFEREFLINHTAINKRAAVRLVSSAIGTLLEDVGTLDIEDAVNRYESKVSTSNYKRTTALITPTMVKNANEAIKSLGLGESLFRTMATSVDPSLVDYSVSLKTINDNPMEMLLDDVTKSKTVDVKELNRLQSITLDDFMSKIIPTAKNVELLLENRHTNKLVALTTAVDTDSPSMFSWGNHLAWATIGDTVDAVKSRVKNAGGNTEADIGIRLAWDTTDDLDLALIGSGVHIYYGNRVCNTIGANLDVDMNPQAYNAVEDPVENIYFKDIKKFPTKAEYKIVVNNFAKRSHQSAAFTVDVEILGEMVTLTYDRDVRSKEKITVGTLHKVNGSVVLTPSNIVKVSSNNTPKNVWGVLSNTFLDVDLIMDSPNDTGMKHKFFIIKGMRADGSIRGFFNEFLSAELQQHRKVFEIVGSKMAIDADKCNNQLCGVGFNKTVPEVVILRVTTGSTQRLFKVSI